MDLIKLYSDFASRHNFTAIKFFCGQKFMLKIENVENCGIVNAAVAEIQRLQFHELNYCCVDLRRALEWNLKQRQQLKLSYSRKAYVCK